MTLQLILDQMRADRRIYCTQPWCIQGRKLTPAQLFIGQDGQPRVPSCCDCARNWQSRSPQPVELWYIDEDLRERWWATIDGAIGAGPPPSPPPQPPASAMPRPVPGRYQPNPNTKWAWLAEAAAFVIGIALIIPAQMQNAASSTPGTLRAFGVLLVVASVIGVIITAAITLGSRYSAWKAGLSPADRRKADVAEVAALWAAWGAVHYGMKGFANHTNANTAKMREYMNAARNAGL